MSKTNSNSITSIFTAALNENLPFRRKVLKIFEKILRKKIDSSVVFYDCIHSPLLYEEMNGKEIDIIARIPGVHKPVMMIEVKANTREPLQDSQRKEGEYENTAKEHHIPLIYIIPKNYIHENEIPKIAKKITWESILEHAEDTKVSVNAQISNFVEIIEQDEGFLNEEIKLFENKKLLLKIRQISLTVLERIEKVLKRNKRKGYRDEQDQWGVGYYYYFKGIGYYVGIVPAFDSFDSGRYFFSVCISEDYSNYNELEHLTPDPVYFEEGYYFVPLLNDKTVVGDKKVLLELREILSDIEINRNIRKNFQYYYSLRTKLGECEFDNLFDDENNEINERVYNKLGRRIYN